MKVPSDYIFSSLNLHLVIRQKKNRGSCLLQCVLAQPDNLDIEMGFQKSLILYSSIIFELLIEKQIFTQQKLL